MPEFVEGLIEGIKRVVGEHYTANSSPLLLSELGARLRKQGVWQGEASEGKSLRQFIESAQDPDLLILRDKKSPAYIAVATQSHKQIVEQWIERRIQSVSEVPDLEALPRAVILAFCVQLDPGGSVYLRRFAPFRYETLLPNGSERDLFVIVEDRYRRPGLKLSEPSELDASDRLDLQTRIAAWSKDKNVPIEGFYRHTAKKHTNALERLIAAQSPSLAEKIVIPGDIAVMLSRQD